MRTPAGIVWRPWLPINAIARALEIFDPAALVADWTASWLGHGAIGAPGPWQESGICENELCLWTADSSAGLWLSADLRASLQSCMFGVPPIGTERTAQDHVLLDQAVEACIQDLCGRIEGRLGLGKQPEWKAQTSPVAYYACAVGPNLKIALSSSCVSAGVDLVVDGSAVTNSSCRLAAEQNTLTLIF